MPRGSLRPKRLPDSLDHPGRVRCSQVSDQPRGDAGHELVGLLAELRDLLVTASPLQNTAHLLVLVFPDLDHQPAGLSPYHRLAFLGQTLVNRDTKGASVKRRTRFKVEKMGAFLGQSAGGNEGRRADHHIHLTREILHSREHVALLYAYAALLSVFVDVPLGELHGIFRNVQANHARIWEFVCEYDADQTRAAADVHEGVCAGGIQKGSTSPNHDLGHGPWHDDPAGDQKLVAHEVRLTGFESCQDHLGIIAHDVLYIRNTCEEQQPRWNCAKDREIVSNPIVRWVTIVDVARSNMGRMAAPILLIALHLACRTDRVSSATDASAGETGHGGAGADASLGEPPPNPSKDANIGSPTADASSTSLADDASIDSLPVDTSMGSSAEDASIEDTSPVTTMTNLDGAMGDASATSGVDVPMDADISFDTESSDGDSAAQACLGTFVNSECTGDAIQIRTWSESERELLPTGLIALWHLNESPASNGAVIADAVGLHPASLTTDDGALNKSAKGLLLGAMAFDGVGDYVDTPHAADLDLAGSFTISVWVNPLSYGGSGAGHIIDHRGSSGNSGWSLYATSDGVVTFSINGGSASQGIAVTDEGALQLNRWTHIGVIRDADKLSIWINGEQFITQSHTPTPIADPSGVRIGGRVSASDRDFAGLVDEVALWNHALSSDDMRALWLRQAGPYGGGQTSSFVSEVFDSQEPSHAWSTLKPTPAAPYAKELVTIASEATAHKLNGVDPTGLVGYWSLDGIIGAIGDNEVFVDRSAQANTGRAHNNGTATMMGGPGKLGEAVYFDGVDDTIDVASSQGLLLDTGMMTLAGWAKPSSRQTGWHAIVGKGNWEYWLEIGGSGNDMRPEVGLNGTPPHRAVSAVPIPANAWSFLAGTYDGKTLSIYVNGVEAGNFEYSAAINQSSQPLTIGNAGHSEYFNGWIDEVSVWNRPLTANEILSLYLRAAMRIEYQVRSCARADCSDAVLAGPDGTDHSFFSELLNTKPALPVFDLTESVAPNRYFQYQAIFETDNPAYSPRLLGVTSR